MNSTLLHFLVETVETNFPKLLGFLEELQYSDQASKGIYKKKKLLYKKFFCIINFYFSKQDRIDK